jgi:uncharacterized membrane protein YfcA
VHVTVAAYVIILLTVVLGASAQGSIGFGQNLIVVPVVALVLPAALPGTLVVSGIPLTALMVLREHEGIDRRTVAWVTAGRVPGTVLGVLVVATVSSRLLGGLAGAVVLVAVAVSLLVRTVPLNPVSESVAGAASGVMGTAAAIDGPPLALLLQHHPGHRFRPTMAACFTVATVMSLVALGLAGEISRDQLLLALALMPGYLIGFAISRPVTRALHGRDLRPIVLGLVTVTGAAAVVKAFVG